MELRILTGTYVAAYIVLAITRNNIKQTKCVHTKKMCGI